MKKKITVIIKKLRDREDEEALLGPAMRLLIFLSMSEFNGGSLVIRSIS